jgi:hypothetical protein
VSVLLFALSAQKNVFRIVNFRVSWVFPQLNKKCKILLLLDCLISLQIWRMKFHTEKKCNERQSAENLNFAAVIFMGICQIFCS